jgi:hypothetical protein
MNSMADSTDATGLNTPNDIEQFAARMLREGNPYVVNQVRNSLTYASLRCLAAGELIEYATDMLNDHYYAAIKILRERNEELSTADRVAIADRLAIAIAEGYRHGLPSRLRARTDRLLGNLADLLEPSAQREIA